MKALAVVVNGAGEFDDSVRHTFQSSSQSAQRGGQRRQALSFYGAFLTADGFIHLFDKTFKQPCVPRLLIDYSVLTFNDLS
jgi:hypothetical protein